jgi:hypothetical protein
MDSMDRTARGFIEVVRMPRGRWTWFRRSQAGLIVCSERREHRWRITAQRAARRTNGRSLPIFIVRTDLLAARQPIAATPEVTPPSGPRAARAGT